MNKLKLLFKKLLHLLVGYFIMATGICLSVKSHIGLGPWDVLNEGLSKVTDISYGLINIYISIIVIMIACCIKIFPGIGTLLNALCFGIMIDFILPFINVSDNIFIQLMMALLGIILLAFGSAVYLMVDFGAGPRDSLLLGLVLKLKKDTTFVKPVLEAIVLIIGFIIGGTVGIGTLMSLFLLGYFMDVFFRLFKFDPKTTKQMNFYDQYLYIKGGFFNENSNT
ncbi:MAG: membrane protein [Bacilli bacterium]|nr:membrane protein [Bacilli bacterium]